MCLRVDVFSNWWVFESLCVSNLLCLRVVRVSAYPPHKCETEFASPKCASVFFARLCAGKVLYIQAARAVNF